MNIQETFTKGLIARLASEFDTVFIEGLKRKGFEFKSRFELESFVKENCKRVEDNFEEQNWYYVHDIPFLIHIYKTEPIELNTDDLNNIKLKANYGLYSYL